MMIVAFSCERYEETTPLLLEESSQQSNFLNYQGNDGYVKKMIEAYAKLERSEELTSILVDRYGMPNWELPKGNAYQKQNRISGRAVNSESEASEIANRDVLIPLSKDDEGRTLAILGWRQLPSGESIFRIFDRQVYEGLSFGQQMELQPLIINGHFLLFDYDEYGTSEINVNNFTIKFPEDTADGCEPGDPDCYCQELRIFANGNDLVGTYITDCYDMSVVVVAYRDDNGSNDYGHQTTSNGFPSFSDAYFANNTFYGPGGGGSTTVYSYDPESLFQNPDQPIDNLYNYLRRGPDSGSRVDVIRYLFSLSNELVKFEDTRELAYSLNEVARETELTDPELYLLALRGRDIFNRVEHKNFNLDLLSVSEEMTVAKDAAFIDFYPEVKKELNGSAISTRNWEGLWEVFKPMLAEVLIEAIPGGGLTLAFRDIIQGTNNADVAVITAGVVALILEFIPPGKVFKAIWRTGKVVRKGYKFLRYASNHLNSIGRALKNGFKSEINGNVIKLLRPNGSEVARFTNNIMEFNYTGFGGKIITQPGKTTTVIGKYAGGTQSILNTGLFKYGENVGGLNLLNDPAWTLPKNIAWLDDAISRNDIIRVISDPTNINNIGSPGSLTTFGEEVNHLLQAGYTFNPVTFTFSR